MRIAAFSIMLIMVLVFQFVFAGELLWDFEDPNQIDDWESVNGTWEINDGVLQETSGAESGMHAFAVNAEWENYTVEAKFKIDEGKYLGLAFRGQADFEYYVFYVELTPNPGNLAFFKHIDGDPDARERPSPNKTGIGGRDDLVHGEWITMKIVVEGNEFICFLNDQETTVGTDNLGNEYTAGKVGVWAWQTKASFDDFKVYGPDIEGSAVDPRYRLTTTWGELKLN